MVAGDRVAETTAAFLAMSDRDSVVHVLLAHRSRRVDSLAEPFVLEA